MLNCKEIFLNLNEAASRQHTHTHTHTQYHSHMYMQEGVFVCSCLFDFVSHFWLSLIWFLCFVIRYIFFWENQMSQADYMHIYYLLLHTLFNSLKYNIKPNYVMD